MEYRNRHDFLPANAKRSGNREQIQLRNAAAPRRRRIEGIREHRPNLSDGQIVGKTGHGRFLQRIEAPDFVDSQDVVRVPVREEQRVHAPDAECERLHPEIRPRINQQRLTVVGLDQG
jgi:hypothetical protein